MPKTTFKKGELYFFEELRHKLPKTFLTIHVHWKGQTKFDWILTKPLKTANKICKMVNLHFVFIIFLGLVNSHTFVKLNCPNFGNFCHWDVVPMERCKNI